ncbi:hypothetical protein EL06_28000 [Salmonella enterica subsp. diarizonae]|uniref:Uncharacterized protein n=1 Tax=Salmonella diarizonae TaxID=59204 RepID=A0A6C8Y808_SALDZ|nr:hypothetical protein [Salmonella enterica subsp. diarizonae]
MKDLDFKWLYIVFWSSILIFFGMLLLSLYVVIWNNHPFIFIVTLLCIVAGLLPFLIAHIRWLKENRDN